MDSDTIDLENEDIEIGAPSPRSLHTDETNGRNTQTSRGHHDVLHENVDYPNDNAEVLHERQLTAQEREFRDKFRPEFIKEIEDHLRPTDVLDYLTFENDSIKEKIRDVSKRDRKEACMLLLQAIVEEVRSNGANIMEKFIIAIESEGYRRIIKKFEDTCKHTDNDFKSEYLQFLLITLKPDLTRKIDPYQMTSQLLDKGLITPVDRRNIESMAIKDRADACRELFLLLQRKHDDWEKLIYDCLDQRTRSKMDPAPDNDDLHGKDIPCSPEVDTPEPDYNSDYNVEDDKEEKSETEKEMKIKKTPNLEFRLYQKELAEEAIKGKNTIICAPTGTGKTWVALHITKEHLDTATGGKRVVFLARTNALVKQQFKLFRRYLPEYTVALLQTETKECLAMHLFLNQAQIFFMTPQILQNNLNNGKVKISDISLMIFDECHHARKKEPYNMLMKLYMMTKQNCDGKHLPQIVGMTATLGIGGSTTEDGALQHMIKICANLDVEEISTVNKNFQEFEQYVHQAEHETVKMGEKEKDPCKLALIRAIVLIERDIEALDVQNRKELKVFWSKMPTKKDCPAYQKWATRFKNKAACKIKNDQKLTRKVNSAMEHIVTYSEALDVNYLMDIQNVLAYIQEKFESDIGNADNQISYEKDLFLRLEEMKTNLDQLKPWPENPYLKLLRQTLVDINDNEPEPRGMVFVKTRATAFTLAKYLGKELEGLRFKVAPFTGTTSSDASRGMPEFAKNETLQKFRDGDINLLVATSVGSEGIDVPECNFIVTYNFTGNETTISQMSGRARKKGSKAYHVSDHNIQQKEEVSLQKMIIMKNAFKKLSMKPRSEFKDAIRKYQEEDLVRNNSVLHNTPILEKSPFVLICFKCHAEVANGNDIRLYTGQHRIVVADDFRNRVRYEEISVPSHFTKSVIKCLQCNKKWGTTFKIEQLEVPVLKVTALLFKLEQSADNRKYKKWNKVPYFIDPIDKTTMLDLFRAQLQQRE